MSSVNFIFVKGLTSQSLLDYLDYNLQTKTRVLLIVFTLVLLLKKTKIIKFDIKWINHRESYIVRQSKRKKQDPYNHWLQQSHKIIQILL